MQCIVMHQPYDGFHFILKNHLKLSQKLIFWLILRGFWFTPSYTLWVTPQSSAKLNVLWRYIIVVSFISVAFVVLKLKIFKCFRGDAASMKLPLLGGFWALSPANMTRVCWNFNHRYVFHKTNAVSEESFKIKCLSGNEAYPKLMVLVHFWAQFSTRKLKILPRTKFFSRNYILMTIK